MSEPTAVEQPAEPAAARSRRWRWIVGIAVAAAVTAGSAGGALWLVRGEQFPRKDPEITTVLPPFSPGSDTKFSIGLDILDKGQDIEIFEVKARTTPNVEFLGAYGIWPRDLDPAQGQPGVSVGFPTGTRSRHRAFGVIVPAAELDFRPAGFRRPGDLFVQAGYRLTSGDIGGLLGLKVRYKVGGKTKSEYFPWGVIVCVKPHRCGGSGDSLDLPGDRDFYQRAYVQLGLVPADEYEH